MRLDVDLTARYRSILSATGLILALCGPILLTPLLALLWWPAEAALAPGFALPALCLTALGLALWRGLRLRPGPVLSVQDGGVIVLLAWVVVTAASALPLMEILGLSFTQAFFEAVSGWTTTGLSVVDVERAPRTVLVYRSVIQLAGGAGMAIILVTVSGGPLGPGVAAAEGRTDQLVPQVSRSARLVLTIYAGYALLGVVLLRLAGLSAFDAVNHSFAAVSTGGFSTRSASLGAWDSPLVEGVVLSLMVLGSTNFQVVHFALRGRWRAVWRNGEVRTLLALSAVAAPLLFACATSSLYVSVGKQVRVAIFEVVSALTTTGFSTSAGSVYQGWPTLGVLLLVPLMLVGGGTGSTAGGIKQLRAYILVKAVLWELRRLSRPGRAVIDTSVWRGVERVATTDREVVQVAVFVVAYFLIYMIGVALLVAFGSDARSALFEYASALGTVGLSVGVTSAGAPAPVLWAEIAGMLLGRLEVFIVLVALRKLVTDGVASLRARRAPRPA